MSNSDKPDVDYYILNRELDRTKSKIMLGTNAFKAALMLGMKFIWSRSTPTADVVSTQLRWNPDWFLSLPPTSRVTVLLHELDHIGRLHEIRMGNRDPEVWNWACDYRINADLHKEGHSFEGTNPLLDLNLSGNLPEEDIYDLLITKPHKQPKSGHDLANDMTSNPGLDSEAGSKDGSNNGSDEALERPAQGTQAAHSAKIAQVKAVLHADQHARSQGHGGMSVSVRKIMDKFLDPVVPWHLLLVNELSELDESDYSWQRPNRRFSNAYLPRLIQQENKLTKLNYYIDTSGSISDADVTRFNSELKFIKEVLNPEELVVVMFDYRITKITVLKEEDSFDNFEVVGRGGTSLHEVKAHIEETKPTAAIIFSDLDCQPMDPLLFPAPVYWVVINNPSVKPPFGTTYHIQY